MKTILTSIPTFGLLLFTLAAQASVVNISATVSGAQPGPGQTFWHDPFNAVPLSLAAGTYEFQIVTPALDSSATFIAWSYNAPYITNYLVFLSTDLTRELFTGAVSDAIIRGTPQAAFDATVAARRDRMTWSFSTPVTILFAVPDNILSDNRGGLSVRVQAPGVTAAPEPGSAPLLFTGLVLTGLALVTSGVRGRGRFHGEAVMVAAPHREPHGTSISL